jgi:hypothetical protein
MDYTQVLAFAENKSGSEYAHVVDEIRLKIETGSNGGEIRSLVGGYLKSLKDQNHPASLALKPEIDIYLSQFIFR